MTGKDSGSEGLQEAPKAVGVAESAAETSEASSGAPGAADGALAAEAEELRARMTELRWDSRAKQRELDAAHAAGDWRRIHVASIELGRVRQQITATRSELVRLHQLQQEQTHQQVQRFQAMTLPRYLYAEQVGAAVALEELAEWLERERTGYMPELEQEARRRANQHRINARRVLADMSTPPTKEKTPDDRDH